MPKEKASIATRHETSDVNVRGVAWTALLLTAALLVISLPVAGLLHAFTRANKAPSTLQRADVPAAEPRLQIDESRDLARFRQREDALLNSYGWTDRKAGTVRIPIERAMDLVLQRGLPVDANDPGKTRAEMRQQHSRTNQ